jgi:hypothetical protein
LHFVHQHSRQEENITSAIDSARDQSNHSKLVIPYVDAAYVADQFNRYRKQHRVQPGNPVNTCDTETPGGHGTDESRRSSGGGAAFVSLDTRMRLDKMLVRSVMREVTGTDPDGDRFIGRVFLGPHNVQATDNACDARDLRIACIASAIPRRE